MACCRIVQGPVRPRKSTNNRSSSGGGGGNERDEKNCCSGGNRDCCHHDGSENRQGNLRRAAETTQRPLTVTPFRTVHQQQNSIYSTTKSTTAPQQHSTTAILKATPVDIPPAKVDIVSLFLEKVIIYILVNVTFMMKNLRRQQLIRIPCESTPGWRRSPTPSSG